MKKLILILIAGMLWGNVALSADKKVWIGVRMVNVTKEIAKVVNLEKPTGAIIVSVNKNAPAFNAGIIPGDIILEFDGIKIDSVNKLIKTTANTYPGKKVVAKILREKKIIYKNVIIYELGKTQIAKKETEDTENESLKIKVRPIEKKDIKERGLTKNIIGLVITEIASDSPINYLEEKNIIIEAQKKAIRTIGDLEIAVSKALKSSEKTLLLVIYNNQNQRRYIGVKLN